MHAAKGSISIKSLLAPLNMSVLGRPMFCDVLIKYAVNFYLTSTFYARIYFQEDIRQNRQKMDFLGSSFGGLTVIGFFDGRDNVLICLLSLVVVVVVVVVEVVVVAAETVAVVPAQWSFILVDYSNTARLYCQQVLDNRL